MTQARIDLNGGFLVWERRHDGTVEIVDIHVDSERRRCGVGRKLLERLFRQLDGNTRVWAITRAENEVAIEFYQACQFRTANPLRRFYCEGDEGKRVGVDAIMFVRKAGGPV